MVQETIKMVKEAEAKAEQILKDAAAQCAGIVEKAKADGEQLKEEQVSAAKAQAQAAMDVSKKESEKTMASVESDLRNEIAALQKAAAGKEAEAIDAVIAQLY